MEFIDYIQKIKVKGKEEKIPIKRGCSNTSCFCTGRCEEIIGYEENEIEHKDNKEVQIYKKVKTQH